MIYSSKFYFEKNGMIARVGWIIKIGLEKCYFWFQEILGVKNFFLQEFWLEKYVWTNFRIITKNSAADPEIGLNVLVRAFLKEKRGCLEVGSNPCGPGSSSHDSNH